jgi:oligoribonuclease
MDLEMSGLDPSRCTILELATVLTDAALEVVAEGPDIVVHQPEPVLEAMDAWCQEHHQQSGLVAQVRASRISLAEAEQQVLEFLREHTEPRSSPLCGNSIWQDRRFLAQHTPTLHEFLHYRSIDVSSIKELARRWYPELGPFAKQKTHRALDDIHESIAELRFYQKTLFR